MRRQTGEYGPYWRCPSCRGAMFPFNYLQKEEDKAAWNFIEGLPAHPNPSRRRCPVCRKLMLLGMSGGGSRELDLCRRCRVVWFDGNEVSAPGEPVLLFPSELKVLDAATGRACGPIWAVYVLFAVVFVASFTTALAPLERVQLFLSLALLFFFGDNVEDMVGAKRFLTLSFLAAVGGAVAGGKAVSVPFAATGIATALGVFYLLTFPRASLPRFTLPGDGEAPFAFPLWTPFGGYTIFTPCCTWPRLWHTHKYTYLQAGLSWLVSGYTLAIVGGAAVGFLYWLLSGPVRRPSIRAAR